MLFIINGPAETEISVEPKNGISLHRIILHQANCIIEFREIPGVGGKFEVLKCRIMQPGFVSEIVKTYLGIRVFDDGFFVSDKELMVFLLKFSHLNDNKVVDFPLI